MGLLAVFVACNAEQSSDGSTTTVSLSTESPATTDATVTTQSTESDSAGTAVDEQTQTGTQQIAEGAKMLGKGIKEEARQAVAAGGAAMEQAGQKLQDKADAAAKPNAEPVATPAAAPVAEGDVANGASIFKGKCAACHGADASGNTPMGKKNKLADLRSSKVQSLTDAELATVIANGSPGGVAAAAHKSKALTPEQIKDVIAYLRSIRK